MIWKNEETALLDNRLRSQISYAYTVKGSLREWTTWSQKVQKRSLQGASRHVISSTAVWTASQKQNEKSILVVPPSLPLPSADREGGEGEGRGREGKEKGQERERERD